MFGASSQQTFIRLLSSSSSTLTLRSLRPLSRPYQFSRNMSVTTGAAGSAAAAAVDMIEQAKRKAAYKAVADHFNSEMQFVGIGSGSTIIYGVEAIKDCLAKNPPKNGRYIFFVPTGFQSRKVIEQAGLMPMGFDSLPENVMLDVAFDGADEVDDDLNCIKGGGACLFQEKLVATRAKKFVCIADYRKNQTRLITKWPSIPIEVAPIAHATVMRQLKLIGSINPVLREHTLAKTGPIQTDQGFYIIDAPFKPLLTQEDVKNGKDGSGKDGQWEVTALAHKIKSIS
ncbi:ribose 5-phosphate isomerase A, partial [Aureobasidium melanogenum]